MRIAMLSFMVFALTLAFSLCSEVEYGNIQENFEQSIVKRGIEADDEFTTEEPTTPDSVMVRTTKAPQKGPRLPHPNEHPEALEHMEQTKRKKSGKREDEGELDDNTIRDKREDLLSKAADVADSALGAIVKETKGISNAITEEVPPSSDVQKSKKPNQSKKIELEAEKISKEKEDPAETAKVKDLPPDNHFAGKEDPNKDTRLAKDYANLLNTKLYGQPLPTKGDDKDDPILFTVANTNVGRTWETIPYREKFQWFREDAPCFTYTITIPDERTGHGQIPICLFRKNLEFKEESSLIIHQEVKNFDIHNQRRVAGQVKGSPGSTADGRFVKTFFYGQISLHDAKTGQKTVYVVEEIKYLSRLLRHSHKLVSNLLMVMDSDTKTNGTSPKFNAVITKGVSILSFMANPEPKTTNAPANATAAFRSFVILSTKQNSYITSGEPITKLDENGNLIFTTRENVVTILTDESVKMKTKSKEYTFRPQGKTMVSEGMSAEALRQLEGVVTITAITNSVTYSCVLPSPSVTKTRQGGFLCKVCLAADHSFREKYLKTLKINDTVSNFLGQTIDNVSWIFRSVDWNGDGKSDNVGLDYDLKLIEWKYDGDADEEEVSQEGMEVLFKLLASVDFSNCCLGISYTMKKFPPSILAKSFSSKPMIPGGACAIRNDGLSNNAILISANNKKGNFSALTKSQLLYLTAREVAIAFGATADTSGQAGCDSFVDSSGATRHYILWPDVMRNVTAEEKTFSTCSKKSIFKALSSCKSSCFDVDRHPFCGNGIVEEGEECDCGSEHNCTLQLCCYGRTGKFPCRKTGAPCTSGVPGFLSNVFSLIFLMLSGISLQLLSTQS